MQMSQTEKGVEAERPDDRSRIERARDEMSQDDYRALLDRALGLATADA